MADFFLDHTLHASKPRDLALRGAGPIGPALAAMKKLNFRLPGKKKVSPVEGAEGGNEAELGEELATFRCIGCGSVENEEGCLAWSEQACPSWLSTGVDLEVKVKELEFELSQKLINLEMVRSIATAGLPDGGGLRATTWKLLLGYLPTDRDLWEPVLAENRSKYFKMKEELLLNPTELTRKRDADLLPSKIERSRTLEGMLKRHKIFLGDHPLSVGKASVWNQYFQDAEIAIQIDRDLPRTHPDNGFFSGDSSFGLESRGAMRNILLLFAKLNPAIGYVQGMNEVLAPLYFVFRTDPDGKNASNAEADSFACFVRLLSDSVDHFCQQLDNSSVGILSTLTRMTELLKSNDEELWQHLERLKVKPQYYAFRWITLLLTQEFNLHPIKRIWDSLLSNHLGVQEMLLRVCCAMLLCVKEELLKGDFAANLKLLQHYPQMDIEYLLQVAKGIVSFT